MAEKSVKIEFSTESMNLTETLAFSAYCLDNTDWGKCYGAPRNGRSREVQVWAMNNTPGPWVWKGNYLYEAP